MSGTRRASLAVQWLGLCFFNAWGTIFTPGQGTRILHVIQHGQKIKKKKKDLVHGGQTKIVSVH